MEASEQYKHHLIKQIAINTGINASSLRSEVDSQNRQISVKSMLSASSSTTEHYDMAVADDEEDERQNKVDTIEREKGKQNAYTGLFQDEHTQFTENPIMSDVKEKASRIQSLAEERFAPSASASGSGLGRGGESTSATLGRPRTRSRPAPGTDDTSNPVGRPRGKAKTKSKPPAPAGAH
eukprot:13862666-Heterocapsa_arctica.AAC.1